jgi:hypothetical protein
MLVRFTFAGVLVNMAGEAIPTVGRIIIHDRTVRWRDESGAKEGTLCEEVHPLEGKILFDEQWRRFHTPLEVSPFVLGVQVPYYIVKEGTPMHEGYLQVTTQLPPEVLTAIKDPLETFRQVLDSMEGKILEGLRERSRSR